MLQVKRFDSTGGYVVHGITGNFFKGRISAWMDRDGNLLDCEQLIGASSRPVKRNGPMWRFAQRMGKYQAHNV